MEPLLWPPRTSSPAKSDLPYRVDTDIRQMEARIMDRDAFQIGDSCKHRSISARSIEAKMYE